MQLKNNCFKKKYFGVFPLQEEVRHYRPLKKACVYVCRVDYNTKGDKTLYCVNVLFILCSLFLFQKQADFG